MIAISSMVAAEIPSASAEAYYNTHFEEKGEGVYEWPEQGLLFIKAVMPSGAGVEAEELSRTRRLMRDWLAGMASEQRQDPALPYGLDLMRQICREFAPDLEYTATWNFSGDTCAFSYERGRMHELVTVVWRDSLLKALPKAFLEPVGVGVWRSGMKSLAAQRYVRQNDLAFARRIGAMDCFVAASESSVKFPGFDSEDFASALQQGVYGEAAHTWGGVDSPAYDEYAQIDAEISKYVAESERARSFRDAAVSVTCASPTVEFSEKVVSVQCQTNVTLVCSTNKIESVEPKIRVEHFAQAEGRMALPVVVASNMVEAVFEECDEHIVTTEETVTIVRTVEKIVRKVSTTYSGEPLFEKLFLSGGYMANSAVPQTERGKAAAKAFAAKLPAAEREARIVEALRENPGDKELWNLYGRILQEKGDGIGAVICFRNALRLDRCYDFALTNLAMCYDALGKKRLACSIAVLAQGITSNQWCAGKLEDIFTKER